MAYSGWSPGEGSKIPVVMYMVPLRTYSVGNCDPPGFNGGVDPSRITGVRIGNIIGNQRCLRPSRFLSTGNETRKHLNQIQTQHLTFKTGLGIARINVK
jgi:hypothetical protein